MANNIVKSSISNIGSAAKKIATFFNMFEPSNVGFAINPLIEIKLSKSTALNLSNPKTAKIIDLLPIF